MPPVLPRSILHQLEAIVGWKYVLTKTPQIIPYTHDATPLLIGNPSAVVVVHSTQQVAAVMRLAYRNGIAVVPRGAGTGLSGGAVPLDGALVLDMTPMNRILQIDRENMTALVEPGVITAVLQRKVESLGLFYPPDPGSAGECTLGGNVAENAGGIRGLKYGVTRDYVLGMEAVLPNGEILNLGGKTVKDVAGYNLKDLLVGSEGTLAIFTKLLLRLLSKPKAARTWLASFHSVDQAGEVVMALIAKRLTPACLELMDQITWRAIQRYTGAFKDLEGGAFLLVEIDGTQAAVNAETAGIEILFEKSKARTVVRARNGAQAEKLKSSRRCAFTALSALGTTAILEDAAVPRAAIPAMIKAIEKSARRHRVTIGNFGHAGDGNLHPTCLIDGTRPAECARAKAAFAEIFEAALRLGGTITGEHGVGLSKRDVLPKQWTPDGIELLRRVKTAFDPKGILNPGKIFHLKSRCE